MSDKATPRPWHSSLCVVYDANDNLIAHTGNGTQSIVEKVANAKLIADSVNAFDAMRAACEAALRYDASIAGRAASGDVDLLSNGGIAEGEDLDSLYLDWITKARAALKGIT